MATWTKQELIDVGSAEELRISSRRKDGTLRRPVIIWAVRHGDDIFVRSVNGPTASWYRGTQTSGEGHITAGGVDRDVTFVTPDTDLDDALNQEYQTKYGRYAASIIDSVNSPQARSATIKLVPRDQK